MQDIDENRMTAGYSSRFSWAGYLLGFAMGGFFDGILLHQILQWHHLLSLVDSPLVADIRAQILADGLFHALMYVIAAIGLILLWRAQNELSAANAARRFLACMLIGFGVWHITDAVVFHWLLQIHRIRVDSDVPLVWDLIWFFAFGIAFVIAGWLLGKPGSTGRSSTKGRAGTLMTITAAAVIGSGMLAALPPENSGATVVLFKPGTTPIQASQAFDAVDGRILWADRSGSMWGIIFEDSSKATLLYRHGALLVSNSRIAFGCLSWIKV